MSEEIKTPEVAKEGAAEEGKEKEKKKKRYSWLWIIIIAIVIVFVALLLTVFLVKDFNTLGDLFRFIGSQL